MPSPTDILSSVLRPPAWEGWVPTLTGTGYRPWVENPGPLSLEDLAYGLAHTFRYGGQSAPAVTVAEHSLLVCDIISILWPDHAKEAAGLLHDASEAVLHDIQSPIRGQVRVVLSSGEVVSWDESDRRVTVNIAKYFGVTAVNLASPEVRAADILAASFEKRDCPNLRPGTWGVSPIPEQVAHLSIRGLAPEAAMGRYLQAAHQRGLIILR